MYAEYYGFREQPFDLTPNPRYLFLTAKHREALSNLQYGISGRRGVTLLLGEAGTGKTTLVRTVLELAGRRNIRCVYLNNPTLGRAEFVEFLARSFGLSDRAAASKTALLFELEQALVADRQQQRVTALLIDEAQAAPLELLEEIRLLANIETPTDKLLPVVLAGQPQLADRLNDPDLKQLKQRVALRCELEPLQPRETAAYIAERIRIAGGDSTRVFTRGAVELVHHCSRGIPRTISVICDNSLVSGFAMDRRPVDEQIVAEVCRDFDFQPAAARPVAVVPAVVASAAAQVRPNGNGAGAHPARTTPARESARPAREGSGSSMFTMFNRRRRFSFF
jgi:general secretion pathway protein A